jgi:AcrR family transcriptional regulator
MKKTSRSRKLASRPPLTRERIFAVALELVDKGGIESVSMRQVAQGLGVEAMSLYKHIANKDDLLDGLVELIFAQMTLPSPDLEWKAALRERAFSVRQALNRYPWAASLIETSGNLGPTRLRHHNTMIGILRKGGFTIELSYNILITFTSYIYGFVIMEQAWFAPPKEKKTDVKPPVISPDELPHILEMINFVSGKGSDATVRPQPGLVTEFEFGLNNLLEGFARVLPK